ncbi:MAG: ABC transporter transmembrane domain-containing protein [Pseudomonadota bacterium]
MLASVGANLLALALPLALMQVYDRIIPYQNYATLAALAIGLLIAVAAETTLRAARDRLLTHAGAVFEVDAVGRLHDSLMHADRHWLLRRGPGELLDRLRAVEAVRAHRSGPSAAAMLDLPFAMLFLGLLAWIAWPVAATIAALTAVTLLVARRVAWARDGQTEARAKIDARRNAFLLETLGAMTTIKSLDLGLVMTRRYERLVEASARCTAALSANALLAQGIVGAAGQAAPVAAAVSAALMVMDGVLTPGGMAACILLSTRVVQPVMKLESLVAGELDARRRADDLEGLANAPRRRPADGTSDMEGEAIGPVETLRLHRVDLRPELVRLDPEEAAVELDAAQDAGRPPLVGGVSLMLHRGEMLAIAGDGGVGKTALLSTIAGRLPAADGEVLVNGADVRGLTRRALTDRVAYLAPSAPLLDGTVLENLTRFRPDLHLEEALRLSEALGIDRFFAKHPQGLDLRVQRGVEMGLPTSVAQLICVVAGLVTRPSLILVDEANRGLDDAADAALLRVLLERRREAVIVMVTQRPSWRRLCDFSCRIEGGRVVADVDHRPPLRLLDPIGFAADPDGADAADAA